MAAGSVEAHTLLGNVPKMGIKEAKHGKAAGKAIEKEPFDNLGKPKTGLGNLETSLNYGIFAQRRNRLKSVPDSPFYNRPT